MIASRWAAVLIIVLISGLVVSCERKVEEAGPPKIKISGAGATFPYPLYKKWLEEYQKIHEDVEIDYKSVGSGAGTKKFMAQEVDFGASDAALTDEQMQMVARGAKLIPATAGIIVLAYNLKGLNGVLKLSREALVDLFLGKIKVWNDPRIAKTNPGLNLPPGAIILVTRSDSSGTTFAFTNHLSAISPTWRDQGPGVGKEVRWPLNTMEARGNEGVAGRIKITDGSIGYVEYGIAQRGGLPMAWLENKEGYFIAPTPANGKITLMNTQDEMPKNLRMFFPDPPGFSSYPIVTYSWLLLYAEYPEAQKGVAVKEFAKWGVTEGQQYAKDLGYSQLPKPIAELAAKAIAEIK
jgi:phosphate transport system substrate-binding protein